MVWTPLIKGKRIKFRDKDVKRHVFKGRCLGFKGTAEAKGKSYDVYGIPCGMPNCNCDEQWVSISKKKLRKLY